MVYVNNNMSMKVAHHRESDVQGQQVGGTWLYNKYPGVEVDIHAILYSFSFHKNRFLTRLYAPGREIYEYLVGFWEQFKLVDHTKFGAEVTTKTWIPHKRKWQVIIRFEGNNFVD